MTKSLSRKYNTRSYGVTWNLGLGMTVLNNGIEYIMVPTLVLRMGDQLQVALHVDAFDRKMSNIVSDLLDCIAVAQVVWLSPLAMCFDAELLCKKSRAVFRALQELTPRNGVSPVEISDHCMESLR